METPLADKVLTKSVRAMVIICITIMVVLALLLSPKEHGVLTWYNLLIPSIMMLYIAATLMIVILLLFIKLVGGVSGFNLSIGMLANLPVATFRTFSVHVGLLPFADTSLPLTLLNRKIAYWSVTAIPSILMVVIGFVIMGICRDYAAQLTFLTPLFNISECSLLALFSQACIINGVVYEIMQIDHLKDIFPNSIRVYSLTQGLIISASLLSSPEFLRFFKEFVLGVSLV